MRRLFLSHAADDAAAVTLVEEVATALSGAGYGVFEYRRDVESGQPWRAALLTALLNCDSAVILKDARSRRRKWIRYERSVLEARSTVPFSQCVVEEIDLDLHSTPSAVVAAVMAKIPLDLPEDGAASSLAALVQDTIGDLAADLDDVQCKLCIEQLILQRLVGDQLQGIPDSHLASLDDRMSQTSVPAVAGVDARIMERFERAWTSASHSIRHAAPYRIATHLVRAPQTALPQLIHHTMPVLDAGRCRSLVRLLGPLLVPLDAVDGLARLFNREVGERGPFLVEARTPASAATAIRRAWGVERGPSYQAPVITVSLQGESHVDAIRAQVQRAVVEFLGEDDDSDEWWRAEVPRRRGDDQNESLWFITMRASECTPELVDLIHQAYPEFPLLLTAPPGEVTPGVDALRVATVPMEVDRLLAQLDQWTRPIGRGEPTKADVVGAKNLLSE